MEFFGIYIDSSGLYLLSIAGALATMFLLFHLRNAERVRASAANAGAEFRRAFVRDISELYPAPPRWPQNAKGIMLAALQKQEAAVGEFAVYLSEAQRNSLREAWEQYKKSCQQFDLGVDLAHRMYPKMEAPAQSTEAAFIASVAAVLKVAGSP